MFMEKLLTKIMPCTYKFSHQTKKYNLQNNPVLFPSWGAAHMGVWWGMFTPCRNYYSVFFSSIGALEIQMSVCWLVCLSVGWLVTFTHNSVIFAPRSFKFCVVVDIEATKKIIKKNFKFFDDDDNDDEDDYSHFRVFGHNSSKNNFLGLKPKNELFL